MLPTILLGKSRTHSTRITKPRSTALLVIRGDKPMNANRQTAVSTGDTQANNTITAHLIRWTGLAAVGGGVIFAAIQPIHPPDVVASVNTNAWAIITTFKTVMCLLFLLGIGGMYARQANKAGWLGLAGWLLF